MNNSEIGLGDENKNNQIQQTIISLSNIDKKTKSDFKLRQTICNGIGVLGNHVFKFDVAKIERIGEVKAEVEKQKIIKKAEGNAEALEIMVRSEVRTKLMQYQEQVNFENIFAMTQELLVDKEVSDIPVDKDWTTRFIDVAKGVSREEVQEMLAKVLAQEIIQPDSYSLKTLEFIRNLTKKDWALIEKYLIISSNSSIFVPKENPAEFGVLDEILILTNYGILNSQLNLTEIFQKLGNTPNLMCQLIAEKKIFFKCNSEMTSCNLPKLGVTQLGQELNRLIEIGVESKELQKKHLNSLIEFYKTKNLELMGYQ